MDSYESYLYRFSRRHWELVDGLDRAYKLRLYERKKLDTVHIDRTNILVFCRLYRIQPPEFWFGEETIENIAAHDSKPVVKGSRLQADIDSFWQSLSHKQKARVMTREVAAILWKDKPELKITELTEHNDIKKYGMAINYGGVHTIRNWIKDLKPSRIK